jgi:hypothetical protein
MDINERTAGKKRETHLPYSWRRLQLEPVSLHIKEIKTFYFVN